MLACLFIQPRFGLLFGATGLFAIDRHEGPAHIWSHIGSIPADIDESAFLEQIPDLVFVIEDLV
ncbi:hypothetical protein KDI_49140 [Dictyobacter arantiisoli]|uniref:Uncharacterized protein n=1 Tax=Dictyobacter arantiisoli TaxID=2014874 RepID=A0A5A5TIC2_9CHLR|nr:hypothetical protein KDI_49140 [Dictyobacter arantiisoli]